MRRVACVALPRLRVEASGLDRRSALERVGEATLALGTTAAIDETTGTVWIEVGGCAHLRGGERGLAVALIEGVRRLGHACRVAIADGPRVASMVARFAPEGAGEPVVVPAGQGASAIRALPIAALALGDDTTRWLAELGLSCCGDLQALPRASLAVRLGARAKDVLALLSGDDRAPLVAWRPPEAPEERAELEWPAGHVEALAFVAKALCGRLAARLAGRAAAAARVEIDLVLDRALLSAGAPRELRIDLALPGPVAGAAELFAVVRARLERVELAAPVIAMTLRAADLARAEGRPLDLLAPEPRAERVLPRLVAELAADLGAASVGTLALADTWVPGERTALAPPFGASRVAARPGRLTTSAIEPSRLVPASRLSIASVPADALELLYRLEGVEWWRRAGVRRDFVAAWLPEPRRPKRGEPGDAAHGAIAWVEVGERRAGWLRGWVD